MASRKDFEATASIVSKISNDSTRLTVARDFADLYAAGNPRFDFARFFAACNVT